MVFFGRGIDEKTMELGGSNPSSSAANATASTNKSSTATSDKETPLLDTTDHEDMVIVDNNPSKARGSTNANNAVSPATTGGGATAGGVTSDGGIDTMGSVGAAASFVNEQVGKVRQMATEGPLSFRVLAFIGGVAMIITSVLDWIGEVFRFSVLRALISVYTFIFGVFICILEGKTFVPETSKYQQKMFGLAKFLKFVWGRGFFYFFAGSLQFSSMHLFNMASGGFMCFVGIISIITGWSTASKLKQMRETLTSEAILKEKFKQYDKDKDGYLEITNFAELVKDIGLELDHNELVAAFSTIDRDDDERISMDEFKAWWTSFQASTVREASMMV